MTFSTRNQSQRQQSLFRGGTQKIERKKADTLSRASALDFFPLSLHQEIN